MCIAVKHNVITFDETESTSATTLSTCNLCAYDIDAAVLI